MGLRGEFQKKIDRKLQEINALEQQVREAKVYVQALEDMMRLLPKEDMSRGTAGEGGSALKAGTAIAAARDAIKKAGHPLHISDILRAIGRPVDSSSRAAIGGSIAAYVRRGEVFTRPAPNTFGLIHAESNGDRPSQDQQPPPEFGRD
jgi:hypothetical protein